MPDVDKLLTPDDGKLLAELHYCFDSATIVEEMLVALLHMQVDICYMRPCRRRQHTGLPSFRKNIIVFPHELPEVKQLMNFWTSVSPNDIVHVEPVFGVLGTATRERIAAVQHDGLDMKYEKGTSEFVKLYSIR